MKILGFLLLILTCSAAGCQSLPIENMTLVILNDTLTTIAETPVASINFRIRNCSNSNFILYELNSNVVNDRFGATWPYCEQENAGAAIVLFVFDSTGRPLASVQRYLNDLKRPMTRERLDSVMSARKDSYRNQHKVVQNLRTEDIQQEIDLRSFSLKKGHYFVQLLYFAGKNIRAFITDDELLEHKTMFNAEVFQGCLMSNRSVLLVK